MSPIALAGEPVVGTLLEEWAVIEDPSRWTRCHGLAGVEEPPVSIDATTLVHVRNATGAANERWVRASPRAARSDARPLSGCDPAPGRVVNAISPEEFNAPTQTPVGLAPYRRFMEIRVFDCWLHEQDIRSAVGRPGHEDGRCAEMSVDEVVRALGFIVGKQASAPDGSAVTIEFSGSVYRTVHVAVDGRAAVVTHLDRPATASLNLSSTLFVKLAGGRADALPGHETIRFDGDLDLVRCVGQDLALTI